MLLNTINRIANHEPQPFIAPIPISNMTKVFTLQDEIPYWFTANVIDTGWFLLHPGNTVASNYPYAYAERTATAIERLKYLEQLPRFHVIALFPIDNNWLVMPFNISDANQRGWDNGRPRLMYLPEGSIGDCQVVHARQLGNILLYDAPAQILLMRKSKESIIAKEIVRVELERMKNEVAKLERLKKLQSVEGRIDESLKHSGAELVDWKLNVDGEYKIEWTYNGNGYTTMVDSKLRVVSAGVCLDGTDNWHSLSTIVHVMEDRRKEIESGDHGDW